MRTFSEIFRANCEFSADGKHVGGSDRQSNHNYSGFYASLFPDAARPNVRNVLEVGCADGSGLLSFREAFPNATITGMDITPAAKIMGVDRIQFWIGDQRNRDECRRAATNNHEFPDRKFDLIVEDAYHSTDNTLLTLLWLWPYVAPGGVYVVEEWADVAADRANIVELFPMAEIHETDGPFGGIEPLVVLRKAKS